MPRSLCSTRAPTANGEAAAAAAAAAEAAAVAAREEGGCSPSELSPSDAEVAAAAEATFLRLAALAAMAALSDLV